MPPPPARRRHDPDRRSRIIDAAIRVVGRSGVAGLTHRTVAAEAGVPLGSTTYHFASLGELLVAALRQANDGFAATVRDSGALADPRADPADALARLMGRWLGRVRAGVELECELHLAALRRPALRPVAAEWTDGVVAALRTGRIPSRHGPWRPSWTASACRCSSPEPRIRRTVRAGRAGPPAGRARHREDGTRAAGRGGRGRGGPGRAGRGCGRAFGR